MLMCDPPSGWMYGFPKPVPDEFHNNIRTWLISEGYPQDLIDSHGDHFYCRFWRCAANTHT